MLFYWNAFKPTGKKLKNSYRHVFDLFFWQQKITISLFHSNVLTYINCHLSEQTINVFFNFVFK